LYTSNDDVIILVLKTANQLANIKSMVKFYPLFRLSGKVMSGEVLSGEVMSSEDLSGEVLSGSPKMHTIYLFFVLHVSVSYK
jgi:hypothetical protein